MANFDLKRFSRADLTSGFFIEKFSKRESKLRFSNLWMILFEKFYGENLTMK